MVEIIPNIAEQTREAIEHRIHLVAPYVQTIQIDIADQTLIPFSTVKEFGFLPGLHCLQTLEAHLIVNNPGQYVSKLERHGFRRLIGHVECMDPREFVAEARATECEVGLALDLETPLEHIEPLLEEVDFVQIMTAQSGASGQPFEEKSLAKIKAIHRNLPDLPIAVEGGMDEESVRIVVQAGASRIVASTYIFRDEQAIGTAIQTLQG